MNKPKKKAAHWPFDGGQKFKIGKNDDTTAPNSRGRDEDTLERYVRNRIDGGRTVRKELSE